MSIVLLVENPASIAKSYSKALSDAGFFVQCEGDAGHAIAAADRFDFDAAIIDASIDAALGERLAQDLRARDPELPIFVCTGLDEESIARWAIEDRMLLLEKPVDEAQLVWLLQAHVGNFG